MCGRFVIFSHTLVEPHIYPQPTADTHKAEKEFGGSKYMENKLKISSESRRSDTDGVNSTDPDK